MQVVGRPGDTVGDGELPPGDIVWRAKKLCGVVRICAGRGSGSKQVRNDGKVKNERAVQGSGDDDGGAEAGQRSGRGSLPNRKPSIKYAYVNQFTPSCRRLTRKHHVRRRPRATGAPPGRVGRLPEDPGGCLERSRGPPAPRRPALRERARQEGIRVAGRREHGVQADRPRARQAGPGGGEEQRRDPTRVHPLRDQTGRDSAQGARRQVREKEDGARGDPSCAAAAGPGAECTSSHRRVNDTPDQSSLYP